MTKTMGFMVFDKNGRQIAYVGGLCGEPMKQALERCPADGYITQGGEYGFGRDGRCYYRGTRCAYVPEFVHRAA